MITLKQVITLACMLVYTIVTDLYKLTICKCIRLLCPLDMEFNEDLVQVIN